MKKLLGLFSGFLILAALTPALYAAQNNRVDGATITVTATVIGVHDLQTQVRNVSDQSPATDVAFGSVSGPQPPWSNRAAQYIDTRVLDNAIAWRLRMYSNNFATYPDTTTWGTQYGGMIGTVDGAKVAMGWQVLPDTATLVFGGPAPGDPALGQSNGWTFLKDAHDVDEPNAVGDQSFGGADATGYTNIAFGSAGFTRIVRPNVLGGSDQIATPESPFYVFFEGNFSGAAASTYGTNLVLELMDQ